MPEEKLRRYSQRVGYSDKEIDLFRECNHRIRHIDRISDAAPLYSIVAEVVEARHCNSGHKIGQRLVLDVDGNFITKLCPSKICVYCGSNSGSRPEYLEAATFLGRHLAEKGIGIVYGGAEVGLMGAVATSALNHGGEVIVDKDAHGLLKQFEGYKAPKETKWMNIN